MEKRCVVGTGMLSMNSFEIIDDFGDGEPIGRGLSMEVVRTGITSMCWGVDEPSVEELEVGECG